MRDFLKGRDLDGEERGIVGIGTMIVFIAMIIVASVAAGVLINTSGSLQQQARATGEETIAEVSSGVKVLAAKGYTASDGDVDNIDLIVRPYAGSQGINLENTVIQYKSSEEVKHLTAQDNADAFSQGSNFLVEVLQDVSGTGTYMLETMGDIAKITIQPTDGSELGPSESATVTFYPNSGFKTSYGVTIPPTTQGTSWYEL